MRNVLALFVLRWALNAFGLWIAVRVFGTGYTEASLQQSVWVFVLAAFIFSIVNAVLKPLIVVLSLPAILLTLGLFTIIINGFMVYVSLAIAPGITMTFWYSVLAGIVLSLINYIVSATFELKRQERTKENS